VGKKLFVGNLAFSTTSDDLAAHFAQAGTCESAAVVTDRATGRSRGFGFVEMASQAEAEQAIQMLNGRELAGRKLNVSEAQDRPRSSGGGVGERRTSDRPRGGTGYGGAGERGRGGFGGGRRSW